MYYARYKEEFDLDNASFTDMVLVKDLIDCEIKMERSQALLTAEQLPIKQEAVGVSEDGEVIMKDEISKAYELHERNAKRKEKLLNLMMATRADKAKVKGGENQSVRDMFEEAISADYVDDVRPDNI